jgi:hypothetical protein
MQSKCASSKDAKHEVSAGDDLILILKKIKPNAYNLSRDTNTSNWQVRSQSQTSTSEVTSSMPMADAGSQKPTNAIVNPATMDVARNAAMNTQRQKKRKCCLCSSRSIVSSLDVMCRVIVPYCHAPGEGDTFLQQRSSAGAEAVAEFKGLGYVQYIPKIRYFCIKHSPPAHMVQSGMQGEISLLFAQDLVKLPLLSTWS